MAERARLVRGGLLSKGNYSKKGRGLKRTGLTPTQCDGWLSFWGCEWRNWQTRQAQDLVPFTGRGGSNPLSRTLWHKDLRQFRRKFFSFGFRRPLASRNTSKQNVVLVLPAHRSNARALEAWHSWGDALPKPTNLEETNFPLYLTPIDGLDEALHRERYNFL